MQNEILINATRGRDPRRDPREEAVRRAAHRARRRAQRGRQRREGPRDARAARHAGGLRRHRPREGGVPVRGRLRRRHRGPRRGRRTAGNRGRAASAAQPQRAQASRALLSEGQEIIVQVAKEPIGTKGARITSHVSIAGRHLVLTPWAQRVGVSRRIDSDRERRRLRDIVSRVRPPDLGFIIRTAGEGARDADLEADVKYLTTVWEEIQMRKDRRRARPRVLYEELVAAAARHPRLRERRDAAHRGRLARRSTTR